MSLQEMIEEYNKSEEEFNSGCDGCFIPGCSGGCGHLGEYIPETKTVHLRTLSKYDCDFNFNNFVTTINHEVTHGIIQMIGEDCRVTDVLSFDLNYKEEESERRKLWAERLPFRCGECGELITKIEDLGCETVCAECVKKWI